MKQRLRKLISICIMVCYLLTLMIPAYAQPSDISKHWAGDLISEWISKGLVSEQPDGKFKPDEVIKKVEFITMINNVFKFTRKASISFSDVVPDTWYGDEVAKAVAAGYIQDEKKGKLSPFASINRLEAAVMLAKVFELRPLDSDVANKFSDSDKIPASSKDAVSALAENNYIKELPGKKFGPWNTITRAEAINIIDNVMGSLINKAGTYSKVDSRNLVINTGNVTVKNIIIKGDLYLTEGIGDGNVTIENVTVKGRTIIHGGGENGITFKSTTLQGPLNISKKDGRLGVTAQSLTVISGVELGSGAILKESNINGKGFENIHISGAIPQEHKIRLEGSFTNVDVDSPGAAVQLKGSANTVNVNAQANAATLSLEFASTTEVNVKAPKTVINTTGGSVGVLNVLENAGATKINVEGTPISTLNLKANSAINTLSGTITKINVEKAAEGSDVRTTKDTTIKTLIANGGVTVRGQAKIESATVNVANVTIEQRPVTTNVASGIVANIGGGSASIVVSASNLTISKGSVVNPLVSVTPPDASLSYSSANQAVATVNSSTGQVTGVNAGTATIYITASKTGYFSSSSAFTVTVSGIESTMGGSLSINPTSLPASSTDDITLTYVPGEFLTNGNVTFTLPAGITPAAAADTVSIAGGTSIPLVPTQISGQTVTITGVSATTSQAVVLTLNNKVIPAPGTYNFTATADADGPGPKGLSGGTGNETKTFTSSNPPAALVTLVSSTNTNGFYNAGDTIHVTVTFDRPVDVTGTPVLRLETGTTDRDAAYVSGSGTNTLTFDYTVQAGDNSANLDYTTVTALTLSGGTIRNRTTTVDVTLTLPAPGTSGSLGSSKVIVIDNIAPSGINISSRNVIPGNGSVTLTAVNGPLTDASWAAILTQIKANTSAGGDWITGVSASNLTITPNADGITAVLNNGSSNPAAIKTDFVITAANVTDRAGNTAGTDIIVDSYSPPAPATVVQVGATTGDGSYNAGDIIQLTVTFDTAVDVTGTPSLQLETGATDRSAVYTGGSGAAVLTFSYTVQAGDTSADLDYVGTGSLVLNGGTIKNAGSAIDASLTLANPGVESSLGHAHNVVVDTDAPTAINISSQNTIPGNGNVVLTAVNGPLSNNSWLAILAQIKANTAAGSSWITGIVSNNLSILPASDGVTAQLRNGSANPATINADFVISNTNVTDRAGNTAAGSITVDSFLNVPVVISVGSTTPDGSYKAGQTVDLNVVYDGAVDVTGAPLIHIETGSVDRDAVYVGGSGTNTLTFRYTVQAGDTSADLDYISTSSFALNGGTIKEVGTGLNAILTLPTVGTFGGAHAIVIDTTAPTAITISSQNTIPGNGSVTLTAVNGPLTSASWTAVLNDIKANTAGGGNWISGIAASDLTITPAGNGVTAELNNGNGSAATINADFVITGTNITDIAGNTAASNITVDSYTPPPPAVVIAVSASTGDGWYKAGSIIAVAVTFDRAVDVTGAPVLKLETGSTDRDAVYTSGSGTATLTFNYTVQAGDIAGDLDYTAITSLALNGGTVKNAGTAVNATLTLAAPGAAGSLAASKAIVIDTTAPTTIDISNQNFILANGSVTLTAVNGPISNASWTAILDEIKANTAAGSNWITGITAADLSITPATDGITAALINSSINKATIISDFVITNTNVVDRAGNAAASDITIDSCTPAVAITDVTATNPDGSYKAGQILNVTVTFSGAVDVTGTPVLKLETGSTDRDAVYAGGAGTDTLMFNYTVQAGDTAADLDYTATTALMLNGATMKNAGTVINASLALPAPGDTGSLGKNKAIIIDTTAPTAINISAQNNISAGGTLTLTAVDGPLTDASWTSILNQIKSNTGGGANWITGIASTNLTIAPAVSGITATLTNTSGSAATINADFVITGTNVVDRAGNTAGSNITIDSFLYISPAVVTVVNSTTPDSSYKAADTIAITVTFDKAVDVTGSPVLHLETGATDHDAVYAGGTGTTTLTFDYVVQPGDTSADLDYMAAASLVLNGGTIKNAGTTVNATLTLAAPGAAGSLGSSRAIKIDTTAPTAINISGQNTLPAGGTLTLTAVNGPLSDTSWTAILNQIKANTAAGGNWITGIAAGDLTITPAVDGITAQLRNAGLSTAAIAADFVITAVNVQDRAGNIASGDITIDAYVPPVTVTGVSATSADGTYKAGQTITVTVTFSGAVDVTGTPMLHMETGATDRDAGYTGGAGTPTLTFSYVVQSGDSTADLDYKATTSLDIGGGASIRNSGTAVNANLTLAAPGAAGSLGNTKAIVVDGIAPVNAGGYPQAGTRADTILNVLVQTNENGKAYFVVLAGGASAPTAAQVKAGTNASNVAQPTNMKGNITLIADNQATITIIGLTQITTYDIYVAAEDTAGNLQSTPLKITMVTDPTPDTTPPVNVTGYPKLGTKTETSVDLLAQINEGGKTYFAVLSSGATAPTAAQVKAGTNASNAALAGSMKGNISLTANNPGTVTITGLTVLNTYDIYVVSEDNSSNLQATVVKLSVTMPDLTPPAYAATYPKLGSNSDTSAAVLVQTDSDGKAYFVVVPAGATAPTVAQVKAGNNGSNTAVAANMKGNVALTANSEATINISGLSVSTSYDIYVVAEDAATTPNLQTTPVKIPMSTSVLVLTGVGVDVAAGKLTGTTTAMQYSLDSTNGTNGTWTDCTAANTNVSFVAGDVYVREKANTSNYRLVRTVTMAPIPDVSGIGYDVAAGQITGTADTMQYRLDGGTWTAVTAGGTTSGITFVDGYIEFRTKATATMLPSLPVLKATIAAATSAPTLAYDDVANTITGLDETDGMGAYIYEYKIGTGAWVSGDVPGDFSGAATVQVRLKATQTTLPSQIQTMTFTANLNLNTVVINVAAKQINGTTATMEYSLNSTNGTDGTWTACTNTNTNVTFTAGKVYVRAKTQTANYRLVATIAPAASAPAVSANVTGGQSAVRLVGAVTSMEYSTNGGSTWSPVTANIAAGTQTINLSIAPNNDLRVRVKATATTLASDMTGSINNPPVVTITGSTNGAGAIDVTGATALATLKLYNSSNTLVATYTLVGVATTHQFTSVAVGKNYYVKQNVNGADSPASNKVDVEPAVVTAAGGAGTVDVTGATPLATLKLYNSSNAVVKTYTLTGVATAYQFTSVTADSGYYVKQTVSNFESAASNSIEVTPAAAGGVGSVSVSLAAPLSTLKLYNSGNVEVASYTLTGSATTYQFSGIAIGADYYVKQTVNSVEGAASNAVNVIPAAVTAVGSSGGAGTVDVSGATLLATLKLYDSSDTLVASNTLVGGATTYQFTAVIPGAGYYVKQTVGGVESAASNTVNVIPGAVTAAGSAGGAGTVDVIGAAPLATLKLYNSSNTVVSTYTLGALATTYQFTSIAAGTGYYVKQTISGAESDVSNGVTVEPSAVTAAGSTDGVGTVDVTGAVALATLKLYNSSNTVVGTYTLIGAATTYRFTSVPIGEGYYVKQTVNGAEGSASNAVDVTPGRVTAAGGAGTVDVSGATPLAVLTLYDGSDTLIATYTLTGSATTYRFTSVPAGTGYYVIQTIGGFDSLPSNTVNVAPTAVTAVGGSETVDVTGAELFATLNLYNSSNTLMDTYTLSGVATSHQFTTVPAGTGYYVKQFVNGVGSAASNAVTVTPTAVSITGSTGGAGTVDVTGASPLAALKLYTSSNVQIASYTLVGPATTHTFTGVPAGTGYYVKQTIGSVSSPASNAVDVIPAAVTVVGSTGGAGAIDVSGATSLANLKLYNNSNTLITSYTLTGMATTYRFTGVAVGAGYYVVQTINGANSTPSNAVDVTPGTVTAVGGVREVNVTGAAQRAVLTLYDSSDSVVATYTLTGTATSYKFTNVAVGTGYYVKQVVNGFESTPSNPVDVLPPTLIITGSTNAAMTINVSGATALATLNLYNSGNTLIASQTLVGVATTHQFTAVPMGAGYYVRQTVNGVDSNISNTVNVAPSAVTAVGSSNGAMTIDVSGATQSAALKLYNSSNAVVDTYTLVGLATTYQFTSVPAGAGYYVRQSINGADGPASNTVTVVASGVTAAGGARIVDVSGATTLATLKLYNSSNTLIGSYTLTGVATSYRFTSVPAGIGYYVKQNINGVDSLASNLVEVTPAAIGGVGTVNVTGATPLAILKLYNSSSVLVASHTLVGSATTHQFTAVAVGAGYYVTQTVSGTEGSASNAVDVLPAAVTAAGSVNGAGTVDVTGATPLAVLKLYNSSSVLVDTYTLIGPATTYQFTAVPVGAGYYVKQTVNGVESAASNTVTVAPTTLVATGSTGGARTIDVTGATALATLKLYNSSNAVVATYTLIGPATTHQFTAVPVGAGYYVKQTVNGADSAASNAVSTAPAAVTAAGSAGTVNVTGATALATLKLYNSGSVVVATYTLTGTATTYQFAAVPAGNGYYVTQTVNGAESTASNSVNVTLAAVGGAGTVNVSGATALATLKLYNSSSIVVATHTLVGPATSHSFTSVAAGTGYYVTQTVGVTEGFTSNVVDVTLAAVGGAGILDVSGATPLATLKLYNSSNTLVASYTLTGVATTYRFTALPAGMGYYVRQTVGITTSVPSNTVEVTPIVTGGARTVTITGAALLSTLRLYNSSNTQVASYTLTGTATTYQFTAVAAGTGYYVKQTISGITGAASAPVEVTVQATGGSGTVYVSGATPRAILKLYNSSNVVVKTYTLSATATTYQFTAVPAGTGYYVTQTVSGSESAASNTITVQP
ncbi:MAG: S-layer homology domain-containing protein [Clostridia bacterium]|nr:S-layer homology domain-containing protein [Clostridia bacterium]